MITDRREMNQRLVKFASGPATRRLWGVDYAALSRPEQVFLCIWELESEVNNGGFHQYFYNDSGKLAPHAVEALHTVGAQQAATIVEQAIELLGADMPWNDESARTERLEAISPEVFESLDEAFYQYPDDLTTMLYRYTDAHRTELGAGDDF